MNETNEINAIGVGIAVIGIVVLLIGLAMPATSTHTSQTCIDDPRGFGQDCVSGAVETPNPLKGPVTIVGFLALIGGIGLSLAGGDDARRPGGRERSGDAGTGDFANKLAEHRGERDDRSSDSSTERRSRDRER